MHRDRSTMGLAILLGAALVLAPSCGGGGGGGGGTTPPGRTATFTPADPTPDANSVTLQAGARSGATFVVRVVVTDVNDFFGTGFRVEFDPASVQFTGFDATASFLRSGGVTDDNLFFEVVSPEAGVLLVSATRLQNDTGTLPGVDVVGSRDLLTLSFTARANTAGNTFSIVEPREVCDPGVPVCTPIPVTWAGGTLTAR